MTKTRTRPVDTRWVSCSREVNAHVSTSRHLISTKPGTLTTLCGCTASHPDVWRGDSRKAKCPTCVRKAAES